MFFLKIFHSKSKIEYRESPLLLFQGNIFRLKIRKNGGEKNDHANALTSRFLKKENKQKDKKDDSSQHRYWKCKFLIFNAMIMSKPLQYNRRFWWFERKDYWFEKLFKNLLNSDQQERWRPHFRMSGSIFQILTNLLRPLMEKWDINFRREIPIER